LVRTAADHQDDPPLGAAWRRTTCPVRGMPLALPTCIV